MAPLPTSRSFSLLDLLVVIVLVGVTASLLMPALMVCKTPADKTRCMNRLRQFGLAAIQYADDKAFFPHNRSAVTLDADETGNHQTKIFRSLLWYGYHDNPQGWICPSSYDMFVPVNNDDVREHMRKWFWQGDYSKSNARAAPFVDGGADPVGSGPRATTEISYGWTRRGMSVNEPSTGILGADRSLRAEGDKSGSGPDSFGNHQDGWNVLKVDGTVDLVTPGYDPGGPKTRTGLRWLRSVAPGGGFLAITNQTFD